jgi:hypothetical protein
MFILNNKINTIAMFSLVSQLTEFAFIFFFFILINEQSGQFEYFTIRIATIFLLIRNLNRTNRCCALKSPCCLIFLKNVHIWCIKSNLPILETYNRSFCLFFQFFQRLEIKQKFILFHLIICQKCILE